MELRELNKDELRALFIRCHEIYMEASKNLHIRQPKSAEYREAKRNLDIVMEEMKRRKGGFG